MKRLAFVAAVLAAACAFAANRYKDGDGSVPTACLGPPHGAFVRLDGVVGCRMSVRVDGGGNIASGTLVPYYCQESSPSGTAGLTVPEEAAAALHCTIATKLDGGLRTSYVCPDLVPAARFGLVAATGFLIKGLDGGSGAAALADAGPSNQPIVRMECWGPNITP